MRLGAVTSNRVCGRPRCIGLQDSKTGSTNAELDPAIRMCVFRARASSLMVDFPRPINEQADLHSRNGPTFYCDGQLPENETMTHLVIYYRLG